MTTEYIIYQVAALIALIFVFIYIIDLIRDKNEYIADLEEDVDSLDETLDRKEKSLNNQAARIYQFRKTIRTQRAKKNFLKERASDEVLKEYVEFKKNLRHKKPTWE